MIHAIDAHAEGEPTRVVVGGMLDSDHGSMPERRLGLLESDELRRYLLFEPRGQVGLHSVVVYPAADKDADVGIVIMEATDYPGMSGSNMICAATVLLETGMVQMREPMTEIAIETPAGLVKVEAQCDGGLCERVRFENVPAYVVDLDVQIEVEGIGVFTADIAWGGAFFAFIDSAQAGIPLVPENAQRLSELGQVIKRAAAAQIPVVHPLRPELNTITFVTWTGPPLDGGDGRNATVVSPGRLDRSPCGTATSARLAVMQARGEIAEGEAFIHESILSTRFVGRIEGLTTVGDRPAVRPSIAGSAWITGVHQFSRDPRDPLGRGFALGDTWFGESHGVAGPAGTAI